MDIYVPDSSVLLKWVLPPKNEQWLLQSLSVREAMLEGKIRLLVPMLWQFEVGNTLSRKVSSTSPALLSMLTRIGLTEADMTPEVRARAFELCAVHGVTFYDACYHALAIARGGTFLTADEKHLRLAASSGNICHIRDWQDPRPCSPH